ncbi:RNA polymerase sigma-70 factor [Rapidithrix thailandica]|uniref:RNA polymerase sigma-70 factor n=1 Tax=Rapidithrix thailandica TaxID=413964 RepID=A0AAW9S3S0_9BACT
MGRLEHQNDEQLFGQLASGSQEALDKLFEKYYSPLCNFALQLVESPDLAEEVVSDVFLTIWLKKSSIELQGKLKAYLYKSVKNQALNYLKRNKDTTPLEEIENGYLLNTDNAPDTLLHYQEFQDQVETVIGQMPKQRQLIFRLNRLDGLKYNEIAKVLSLSVHTVQNQMVEAVKFINRHATKINYLYISLWIANVLAWILP